MSGFSFAGDNDMYAGPMAVYFRSCGIDLASADDGATGELPSLLRRAVSHGVLLNAAAFGRLSPWCYWLFPGAVAQATLLRKFKLLAWMFNLLLRRVAAPIAPEQPAVYLRQKSLHLGRSPMGANGMELLKCCFSERGNSIALPANKLIEAALVRIIAGKLGADIYFIEPDVIVRTQSGDYSIDADGVIYRGDVRAVVLIHGLIHYDRGDIVWPIDYPHSPQRIAAVALRARDGRLFTLKKGEVEKHERAVAALAEAGESRRWHVVVVPNAGLATEAAKELLRERLGNFMAALRGDPECVRLWTAFKEICIASDQIREAVSRCDTAPHLREVTFMASSAATAVLGYLLSGYRHIAAAALIGFDFEGEALLATTFAAIYGGADLLDAIVGWIFADIGANGDGYVAVNIGACEAAIVILRNYALWLIEQLPAKHLGSTMCELEEQVVEIFEKRHDGGELFETPIACDVAAEHIGWLRKNPDFPDWRQWRSEPPS
ncbi:MAG: hypothetical protein LBI39_04470 [Puniceicoccales bacterium]|nr:hypothetical protein [Puniceicoccales bacterium]